MSPLLADKKSIWETYRKPGHWKQSEFVESASNFYDHSDTDSMEIFAESFFEHIEAIESNFHRDYFWAFFVQLSPAFLATPAVLKGF